MRVFKIKTGSDDTYRQFNTPSVKIITVDHLIQYDDKVKIGDPVFFLFGGDGTPWENGLAGICKIASLPLELGYETAKNGKYYKLELEIIYKLQTHMTKLDFSRYPETFDTGIGPSTKGERNQALGIIENTKAVAALCRALLDKEPEIATCISDVFGDEISNMANKNTTVYVNPVKDSELSEKSTTPSPYSPTQIIYYGVPGSGKSNAINNILKNELADNKDREEQVCRVVFHPEYTNADFVGQILPRVKSGDVKYEFKPGPFTKILYKALHNPGNKYFLIIEEINRGNAAAIFGDIFQLLDRIKSDSEKETIGNNTFGIGWSKYFIENDYINNYIRSKVEYSDESYIEEHNNKETLLGDNITFTQNTSIRLPPNLSLYATMNTSDQNVFTLDNAFQRRWDMKLIENKFEGNDSESQRNAKIGESEVTWEAFQTHINKKIGEMSSAMGMSSMEDKRLGCWFVKAEGGKISKDTFAEKVLKYLWDDAFKFNRDEIFDIKDKAVSLETIVQTFKNGSKTICNWNIFKDTSFISSAVQNPDSSNNGEENQE